MNTDSMRTVDAPPKPAVLVESMRDIGYSLETALADVVDNSLTAGATAVHIRVDTAGPAVAVGIIDNGKGMSQSELIEAMRLGSRHPRADRASNDLGRFGLGLKTASLSQCRRLTVVTRQGGATSAATWDLDHVAREDRWSLILPPDAAAIRFVDQLGERGALVLWEHLDRATELDDTPTGRQHFIRRIDEARRHLELVFHRYLSGEPGLQRVAILMNGIPLKGLDPFNSAHPATIRGKVERVLVGGDAVEITAFTLPHHRNVSEAEWEQYSGHGGYVRNQGFYLYRNRRLILHGTWFGLARQTELTKLSRVRIDMPNSLDTDWQVDVKKASARPPIHVRERLRRLIGELGAQSRTVYTTRGVRLSDSPVPIWERVQDNNAIVYRLNRDHPLLNSFAEGLPLAQQLAFARMIEAVGAGLPMDALFADLAGSPERVRGHLISDDALIDLLQATITALRDRATPLDSIIRMLEVTEPFRSQWDRSERIISSILGELTNDV